MGPSMTYRHGFCQAEKRFKEVEEKKIAQEKAKAERLKKQEEERSGENQAQHDPPPGIPT